MLSGGCGFAWVYKHHFVMDYIYLWFNQSGFALLCAYNFSYERLKVCMKEYLI